MLAQAAAAGDAFDDWLIGAGGNDTLRAHDGNDALLGFGGNDDLSGGAGDDIIDGGTGADSIDGGTDLRTLGDPNGLGDTATHIFGTSGVTVSLASGTGSRGEASGDTLIGIENLAGSEFDDELFGDAGINLLLGFGGNDLLDGGSNTDGMAGGIGDDTYIVDNADDLVVENAGEGTDTVNAATSYTLLAGSEVEVLNANAGATGLTLGGNEFANRINGGADPRHRWYRKPATICPNRTGR
jgi:Ca2+-binding RTX toxin-like protein